MQFQENFNFIDANIYNLLYIEENAEKTFKEKLMIQSFRLFLKIKYR